MTSAMERVRTAPTLHGRSVGITGLPSPAPTTPTAAAAAEQRACPASAVAGSLAPVADGTPLPTVAVGGHRADLKKRRVTPESVLRATGRAAGGTAPLGRPAPLRIPVDAAPAGHPGARSGAGPPHSTLCTAAFGNLIPSQEVRPLP